jgi:transposase-like protein
VYTPTEENDMSNAKRRRHFTGQEKVAILRRHLVDKVPVSDLCEEHGIHPTLFYRWQKDWFEQGAVVFDAPRGRARNDRQEDAAARRITALQEKLRRKDEVLSELMEEHVALKKSLGEA